MELIGEMELRKDPITRSWVLTGDWEAVETVFADGCPYCDWPVLPARPIFSIPCNDNEAGWATRVVPHPHPLYQVESPTNREGVGMYDRMDTTGAHEVIIENPHHSATLWKAEDTAVERVLATYAQRIEDLKRDIRLRYILVFKNYGSTAGQEIEHAHSELTAMTFIPRRLMYEIGACREYYQVKERCVFCDIIQQEERSSVRVVEMTPHYVALCPFASRVPYEMWLLPRQHSAAYETGFCASPARELAGLLRRCLTRLLTLVEAFQMVLHTTPNTQARPEWGQKWDGLNDSYHWHFEILPIVRAQARSYGIKEVYYCPLSPERAAERLRNAPCELA
jgi:UDPglucose--hexose-1-phosphate uridylyltransferase